MKKHLTTTALFATIICSVALLGCETTGLRDIARQYNAGALDNSTVVAGLKEALRVGTDHAASELSKPGGFSNNPALRLTLPSQLDDMAGALRRIGMGGQVDRLEVMMNEAAEKAAGEAIPVFANAISQMSVRDAMNILNGPSDAATQYFRQATSEQLRQRFKPVVDQAINQVGLAQNYQTLVNRYNSLPFSKPVAPDIEAYVTQKTLDGMFSAIAQQEALIREDPAARTTALLQQVFGSSR